MPATSLRALYICYLSLEDPLTHTQVVAYLQGLSDSGHPIHLLTFETGRLTRVRRREIRAQLAAHGIRWHGLRYHKRPSLPATAFDVLIGAVYATALTLRNRIDVLHARSHVPAAMAMITRFLLGGRPRLLFDIRGLMAEEYVDAGRWREGGVPFRLTKWVEGRAVSRASGIVVLTDRTRQELFGDAPRAHVRVIPCCVNLHEFERAHEARSELRAQLGLADSTVMVYIGKFGGWYMTEEMANFFSTAKRSIPSLHFLILTQGPREEITAALDATGVADYTITSVAPEDRARYLAAGDFGIALIQPSPSKASSSPTKVGEYLAAGLPILCTAGVGDLDRLITPDIGVRIEEHSEARYNEAADQLSVLMADPRTPARCRATAQRELGLVEVGLPRYRSLYVSLVSEGSRGRR